ncbi:MAG TPA: response regulator transcription factor [Anaerolineales bacterium]|nr:response regulator transcription factor [Anaerolineales bacterium]
MISILLVEDHAVFASVLARLLSRADDVEMVKIARTAERALQELPEQEFDLVLVDVALPEMNGISLVALLHEEYPDLPCLMLSGHALAHYVDRALRAGARGYVLKDDSREIVNSVRHVLRGEIYVSPELQDHRH